MNIINQEQYEAAIVAVILRIKSLENDVSLSSNVRSRKTALSVFKIILDDIAEYFGGEFTIDAPMRYCMPMNPPYKGNRDK